MKKIENLLFWPVLVLLFFSASKYGGASTDIHVADTYYIVSNAAVAGGFAVWLLVVIFLFKRIRRRHQAVHNKFAFTYITLTVLFFGVFLGLGLVSGGSAGGNFTDSQLDALMFRTQLRMVCAWCYLFVQVIFLIYFIFQLFKKPVNHYQPEAGITNRKQ
jgi:heme O synthase-like polyprenyltransferase